MPSLEFHGHTRLAQVTSARRRAQGVSPLHSCLWMPLVSVSGRLRRVPGVLRQAYDSRLPDASHVQGRQRQGLSSSGDGRAAGGGERRLLQTCSCEQEFELFTDERSVGAILGFVRKQMAFSCRSSHAVLL